MKGEDNGSGSTIIRATAEGGKGSASGGPRGKLSRRRENGALFESGLPSRRDLFWEGVTIIMLMAFGGEKSFFQ